MRSILLSLLLAGCNNTVVNSTDIIQDLDERITKLEEARKLDERSDLRKACNKLSTITSTLFSFGYDSKRQEYYCYNIKRHETWYLNNAAVLFFYQLEDK